MCSENHQSVKNGVEFVLNCLRGSRYQFESGQFIENICKNSGKLTSEKWKKIEKKLNSKYKLLIPTEKEDWEEMISEGIDMRYIKMRSIMMNQLYSNPK